MKSKEAVKSIISQAPTSRAFNVSHTSAANTTASRIYALVLILSGAACIFMTEKVYHALPFILGIGMTVIELVLGFLLRVDPSAVQHHVLLPGLELAAVGWQTLRESK